MKIIDTTGEMNRCFASGGFRLEDWEKYIDASLPGAKELCLADVRECLDAGYSWEGDFMPVLNGVLTDARRREEAIKSFHAVADGLDETLKKRFGRTVDADLVLYLGLCSGAGWVTEINGRPTVLFGIEKILELDWQGEKAMTGLILHELGHLYQAQYGVLEWEDETQSDGFLRQLFTEGVAMVFEQEALCDPGHFHQYDEGWKTWCDRNAELIRRSFTEDMKTMTPATQRYFGDWVSFEGHGDTGYYLGTRFVRFLMRFDTFDSIIGYDADRVKQCYGAFLLSDL